MKARILFALAALPLVISGCGGDYRYNEIADDITECIVGEWQLNTEWSPEINVRSTITYNADMTYQQTTVVPTQSKINAFLATLLLNEEYPDDLYNYQVSVSAGTYEFYDGTLRTTLNRIATANGDYESATLSDAKSLLASTPAVPQPSSYSLDVHCDRQYLDGQGLKLVNDAPLTYQSREYNGFKDDKPGSLTTRTVVLNQDASATVTTSIDYMNHLVDSNEDYLNEWHGIYRYNSKAEGTIISLSDCYSGDTQYCLENSFNRYRAYRDKGSVIISDTNDNTFYSRQ